MRDLEQADAHGSQARIIAIATEHGIASRYTSFIVREIRSQERQADGPAETRVIPVHAPAGWAMFEHRQTQLVGQAVAFSAPAASPSRSRQGFSLRMGSAPLMSSAAPPPPARLAAHRSMPAAAAAKGGGPTDPVFEILASQLASGTWDDLTRDGDAQLRQLQVSGEKLLALLRLGIDASHPQHGPLVRKALSALTQLASAVAMRAPDIAEHALAIAWLCASGPRSKRNLRAAISDAGLTKLVARLDDEPALRAALLVQ